eukprot:TRINITY_DN95923_c0_g1_i3.p1 TRINITY_DN95923_c0_g1~~TRINITY_DN95923_c0_g1_i3.p1  ORF type:complete len:124 (+),score=18.51 TRINITY_DN95923_c0_g1_i3:434-805(+)
MFTCPYMCTQESGNQEEIRQPVYWYSKDLSDRTRPVYCHYLDGSQAAGDQQNVWTAARNMSMRAVLRDRGYDFPLHNVAVDSDTGIVTGQNVKTHCSVSPEEEDEFLPSIKSLTCVSLRGPCQ